MIAGIRAGFCNVDENVYGPVQLNEVPGTLAACRNKESPEHTGLLLVAVSGGVGVIVTVMTALELHAPPPVTVTVYCPVAAGVTFIISGSCIVDKNEFGPVQI